MVDPWPLLGTTEILDAGLFRVARHSARSPRTGMQREFLVIDIPDFVLVVAVTGERDLVLVRQYRHGARAASLEVPGGLHDGDDETPLQGAMRELLEETGYGGGSWRLIGKLRPQPALQANRAWIFLATGIGPQAPAEPDEGEDIDVELLPLSRLAACIADGGIDNALTVAALGLAQLGGHLQEEQT
jgi:8-oxo-dGTP pyrophosphatase MutT (NUDIX family)